MNIDICICTFRRPQIEETLRAVSRLELDSGVSIRVIVVDNDDTPSAQSIVEHICDEIGLELLYLHAPARNISIARNACLDAATAQHLAFIDDDEVPSTQWLRDLIETMGSTDAHMVLGPVVAIYESNAPKWMRSSELHSLRPTWVHGKIVMGYTGNMLLARSSDAIRVLRFREELGTTGGEDTAFSKEYIKAGGTIAFADNAIVTERVPTQRASLWWLIKRRLRYGQTYGLLLRETESNYALLLALPKAAICALMTIVTSWSLKRSLSWLLRGALHTGVVSIILGSKQIKPYATSAPPVPTNHGQQELARPIRSQLRPAYRMQKQATMELIHSTSPEVSVIEVSVIIAAYNVAPYIERAVRSALAQEGVSVEVIVADDGSIDNTVEVVDRIAAAQVRTLSLGTNGGPGAARNAAIESARGDWIAVLDGDDAFLPGRLAHCLRSARAANAQVVVDDLLVVDEDGSNPRPMFDWLNRAPLSVLTPEIFIAGNSNFLNGHSLGYVKPLVERRFIVERGVRYPTGLSIGEDYLFLLELLIRGATCHVDPTPGYAYTARVGSTSHRLTQADVKRIQHGDAEFMKRHRLDPAAMATQQQREANLLEALDYKQLVEQIKHGKLLAALVSIVTRPMAARHLWQPVKKRLARLSHATAKNRPPEAQ